jgi:excinuclease ABC subunit C
MNNSLKEKITRLPQTPGVYLFKDASGEIIYIGKAKALKRRVASYFSRALDNKRQIMKEKIADLEYVLASSEAQAQIQEAALIKQQQPQYNIDLKDDKSFPWIRISDEEFPLVSLYRKRAQHKDDSALYFGPYTDVKLLRQAIKLLRRIFTFRSCKKMPPQPCLYYRLKLCPGPCAGRISASDYQEIIKQIRLFLEFRCQELTLSLSQKMLQLAGERKFEAAARVRDKINCLASIAQGDFRATSARELEDLQRVLNLVKPPQRIEAFDISNTRGQQATGSMVSFYQGLPDKDNYRRFRIKTVVKIDDYQMTREVLRRRYTRSIRERLSLPDLILIDGGKGHLQAARKEIARLAINIPLVSLAKDKENIYTLSRAMPLRLKEGSPALNLLRRIRDEAHRFARAYHHLLRKKKIIGG